MSENSLILIPNQSLPSFRDKFKVDWPKHIVAFNLIENTIKYRSNHRNINDGKRILSLNGDWEDDGAFVAILRDREILCGSLGSQSYSNLKAALKLVDFTSMKIFNCVHESCCTAVREVIKELGLRVLFDDGTKMKHISKEDAKLFDVDIPNGFRLDSLSKDHAAAINAIWPHRSEGSIAFVEHLINHNPNIGLFNEFGKLLAWCLSLDFGSLAILQVDDNHFQKGYGEIVTKAITKKIALESDIDVTSNIVLKNFKSEHLFAKLGFKDIQKNFWIGVKKTG